MSYSLQRRLTLALTLSAVAIIVITSIVSAVISYTDASDEQDEQLKMVAELAAKSSFLEPAEIDDEDDPAAALFIAAPGTVILPKGHATELRLPAAASEGFSSSRLASDNYRLYTARRADGRGAVTAAQRQQVRVEAAFSSMATAVLPLLVSMILIWLVIRILIRRTFRSIGELGHQMLSGSTPVSDRHTVPVELLPFIKEVETAWQRQRLLLDGRARFVSNVAHELRSPLAALALQIDNVASVELSPDARSRLDLVRGGVKRSSALLQQLLDLGAIQHGNSDLSEMVDVSAVVRQAIELVIPDASARHIELQVERLDAISFKGSSTALLMLLRNALDNAIRYSPINSMVEISVVRSVNHMVLRVADQGSGMDAADIEHAFEPFFRSVRARDESGSGLGLAIVAEAAALLGGTARLKPRKQRGISFEYCQPLDSTSGNPAFSIAPPLTS